MTTPHFDPFNDRTSRDLRNLLARALTTAISQNRAEPVLTAVEQATAWPLLPCHQVYLKDRQHRFDLVRQELNQSGPENLFAIFRILWNQGLFFEAHEFLEGFWFKATGTQREISQGLIQAAGVYVLLAADNREGALKMATKPGKSWGQAS